jgi:HK97 family phage major capsid protein/HK97 family phage prohead protease
VEASLSSELPALRFFGWEVLSHESAAIDMSRAKDGLPLLFGHDPDQPIGAAENIRLEGGKLKASLRFGKTQKAEEVYSLVKDGLLKGISIGYSVDKMEHEGTREGQPVMRVVRWTPLEISTVTIPMDHTVGIGRSRPTLSLKKDISVMENTNTPNTANNPNTADRRLSEVREIMAIARAYEQRHPGSQGVAARAVEEGWSEQQFRNAMLEHMGSAKSLHLAESNPWEVDMSKREAQQFSFVKAIRAMMDPKQANHAGIEMEASRAVAKQLGREPQGLFVPRDVLKRDLNIGTATAGGNLVPTQHLAGDFIGLLRNRTRIVSLGARVLSDLRGNVAIPRQTGAGQAYWVAEGGAPTESQQAFDQVALSPKTVGGFTDYTRKMLLQASPDVEQLVRSDLAAVIALEIDRVAIHGSGAGNEPLGILNTAGIGSVAIGTDGGAPTYAHIVDLLTAVAQDNADEGMLAFLTNSKVRGKLLKTEKSSGTGLYVWESGTDGDGRMIGFRSAVSNQVPSNLTKGTGTNLSAIIFGAWNNLLIGDWSGLDLMIDPYTLGTSGGVRVIALHDVDVAVRHAEAFAAIVDASTA